MGLTSDIVLDVSKFDLSQITPETTGILSVLEQLTSSAPSWQKVGAAQYRALRDTGGTPLPPRVFLPAAKDLTFPSRDPNRTIPIRLYTPDNGHPTRGIILHAHGGGFVLGTHQDQDASLQRYANTCQLTALSVGYRVAPEDPWPAAVHDVFDVATHLVDNGQSLFNAPLLFIVGESAGATLVAQAAFHIARERPEHRLAGVILPYGWFDLTLNLPSIQDFKRELIINTNSMRGYADAYVPGMSIEERTNPLISPLYDGLLRLEAEMGDPKKKKKALPPALFLCGTADPLLDDTLLMSAKWMASGSQAVVKIFNGAPHGFTVVPGYSLAAEASEVVFEFIKGRLGEL
ncbi:Alpha/Beta hydrolase protein [Immersiella caudata]|uniref:Alpha/Beta hydrolase protein n=1 Tax=Immersiella caudata TaxID=314043 RepID=A0AA40C5H8_9PEZI|nr:Alpha/Beta hydrolase protein [Immersiella caudata]